jgi:hypothetical protein
MQSISKIFILLLIDIPTQKKCKYVKRFIWSQNLSYKIF